MGPMVLLRADPWTPQYGMSLEAAGLEEPDLSVDSSVEISDWSSPLRPPPAPAHRLAFADGVRRAEVRLWAEEGDRRIPGLFGTCAVGSVMCDGGATFGEDRIERALVLGGGVTAPTPDFAAGGNALRYSARSVPGTDPVAPLVGLQELMREQESMLAARLAAMGGWTVLVDGPLSFLDPTEAPIVGLVKRFVRAYLGPEEARLLPILGPGERTPLFALGSEPNARFGWYVRLTEVRPPWHDHAGIIRCEVRTGVGLSTARALADRLTSVLPSFGGRASDPRAPQNLAPIGALESRLRHRMGDARYVRRAVLEWLVARG